MIVIDLVRGLGNQMFQYAVYAKFKHTKDMVYFKKSYTDDAIKMNHDCEIFDVYGIERNFITVKEFDHFMGNDREWMCKIRGSLRIRNPRHIVESENGKYNKRLFKLDNVYLEGYWQSEKYFLDIKDEIIQVFTPHLEMNSECLMMKKKIESDPYAVSVHLRLGDYKSIENQKIYGNICTSDYYRIAFSYFTKQIGKPTFYVFSNDISEASQFFSKERVQFVECNSAEEAWADMHLMSLCKHHIIANSTFSWWGAYLNRNEKRIVIAPKRFKNNCAMPDICPENWLRF